MNSCVAAPNVAVGRAGAISAMPASSKLADLLYEISAAHHTPRMPLPRATACEGNNVAAAAHPAATRSVCRLGCHVVFVVAAFAVQQEVGKRVTYGRVVGQVSGTKSVNSDAIIVVGDIADDRATRADANPRAVDGGVVAGHRPSGDNPDSGSRRGIALHDPV